MKTRWEFKFSSWNITFPKEYRFLGTIDGRKDFTQSPEFEVGIIPNKKYIKSGADDGGEFHITLSGNPDETEDMAHIILLRVKEQISFPDARIDIFGGLIIATRIPDNQQEAEQIGDKLHDMRVAFVEFKQPAEFDPSRVTNLMVSGNSGILLQLFNEAKKLERPIEKYFAFFKILEKAYADDRRNRLAQALLKSDHFFNLHSGLIDNSSGNQPVFGKKEFTSLVRKLIRIRDNCAHLRGKTGYLPNDERLRTEVEPHLDLLMALSERIVQNRINWKSPPPNPQLKLTE